MAPERLGTGYAAAAYGLWGLFPLYWPLLEPAGAPEILTHRIIWSLGFVLLLLAVRGRLRVLVATARRPRVMAALTVAAAVIAVNWGMYIWGVNHGHVVETSLGYYINPLVLVALGVVLLSERLRRAQWAALGLGAVAVVVLTVDYGRPPWIALVLAVSFSLYALAKKRADVGALEGLALETAVLFLPALAFLGWLQWTGQAVLGHTDAWRNVLLVGSGLVTAVPLLFFGAAATRVPLRTLGFVQYMTPTIQLLIGVAVYGEPMPPVRLAGFALVWTALVLLTIESLRHHRRQLRESAEAVAV